MRAAAAPSSRQPVDDRVDFEFVLRAPHDGGQMACGAATIDVMDITGNVVAPKWTENTALCLQRARRAADGEVDVAAVANSFLRDGAIRFQQFGEGGSYGIAR